MTMVRDIYGPMLWLRGEVEISDGIITLDPKNAEIYVPTVEPELWADLLELARKDLRPSQIAAFARRYGLLRHEFIEPGREIEELPLLQECVSDWQLEASRLRGANDVYYFLWHAVNGMPTEKLEAENWLFQKWRKEQRGLCQIVYGAEEIEELADMRIGDYRLIKFWSSWLAKAISSPIAEVREQLVAGADTIRVRSGRGWTTTAWPGIAQMAAVQQGKAEGYVRAAASPLDFSFAVVCPDLVALAYWQLGRRVTMGEIAARCTYCGKYFPVTRKNKTKCSEKCGNRFRQRAKRVRDRVEKV